MAAVAALEIHMDKKAVGIMNPIIILNFQHNSIKRRKEEHLLYVDVFSVGAGRALNLGVEFDMTILFYSIVLGQICEVWKFFYLLQFYIFSYLLIPVPERSKALRAILLCRPDSSTAIAMIKLPIYIMLVP